MPRVFGVSLNARAMGVSLVESRFGVKRTLKSEKIPLPAEDADRAKLISETMGRLMIESGARSAVIGLPLRHFLCKVLDMPLMSRGELRGALTFELEKHLPLAIDEYLFDFTEKALTKDEAKYLKTTVLAVRRDIIEAVLKPFQDAGVSVLSVACSTLVGLEKVLEEERGREFSGVFIHGIDDAHELVLAERGMPVALKRAGSDADIVQVAEQLREGRPGLTCSAGAVDPSVTERIGCKKFFFNLPDLLAVSADARGLAGMNFLPPELIRPRRDVYPFAIGGLAAASVFLFLATGAATYYRSTRTLGQLESRVREAKARSGSMLESRKKADQLFADVASLRSFGLSSNTSIRVLAGLCESVPVHTWIVNFSMDDKGKVEIEGISKKTAEVVVALEKSGLVKNVSFSAPITYKDGEERFSLRMEAAE